jgi:hypothetical protein
MLQKINPPQQQSIRPNANSDKQLRTKPPILLGAMLPKRDRWVCLVAEFGQCFQGRTLAEDN